MAKFNYQKLSRDQRMKKQHVVNSTNPNNYTKKVKNSNYSNTEDLPLILNGPNYILKFGKYKDVKIRDVPIEYIIWASKNLDHHIVETFKREFFRRKTLILESEI